ncbi:MAG: DUF1573 domain-containing protein [Phycisphaerales bacterium]|nr:DUF1573 domain-containing protein [Phycisphaerales bacterium]
MKRTIGLGLFAACLAGFHAGCASAPILATDVLEGTQAVSAVAVVEPTASTDAFEVVPAELDCGTVSQCDPPNPLQVRLRNGSAEPVGIRGFVATCGCTIPDLKPNITIAPGGEVVVNIRLELWGQGRKQQFIRFVGDAGQPIGRVRIQYEVSSALRTTPSGISRDLNPDGTFQIDSMENSAFVVTQAEPAVIVARSNERANEQAVAINWEAVDALAATTPPPAAFTIDESGKWSTLLVRITTDCPGCSELFLWVKNSAPVRTVTH